MRIPLGGKSSYRRGERNSAGRKLRGKGASKAALLPIRFFIQGRVNRPLRACCLDGYSKNPMTRGVQGGECFISASKGGGGGVGTTNLSRATVVRKIEKN